MNNKFDYMRKKYPLFIYHSFDISDDKDDLKIVYDFEIEGLSHFNPYLKIPKNIIKGKIDNKFLNNIDYPNTRWGYGALCLSKTLNKLKTFNGYR